MSPSFTIDIEMIKNAGAVLAIFTGIFAIIANWRTLFAPHQKKLKDEEFDVVKQLIQKLADPHFLIFYTEPSSRASIEFAKNAVLTDVYSPFLPKSLRTPIWDYIKSVFALKEDSQAQKDHLWERHRALYRRATKSLGARGELPDFTTLMSSPSEERP
jgi:hypothetical protein